MAGGLVKVEYFYEKCILPLNKWLENSSVKILEGEGVNMNKQLYLYIVKIGNSPLNFDVVPKN